MSTQCPQCGFDLLYDSAKYCSECGTRLQPAGESITLEDQYRIALDWDQERSLRGFNLTGRDLAQVELPNADLREATFSRANLTRADLSGSDLSGTDFQWADLHWANLQGVELRDGNLMGAFLWYSRMHGASLIGANFQRASLRDAQLQEANLSWANLQWADLSWANLRDANLGCVNLRGADLSSANLIGAFLGIVTPEGSVYTQTDPVDEWCQLAQRLVVVNRLHLLILPSGQRYDGRLRRPGDIERALYASIDTDSDEAMSDFYGVPVEAFVTGQTWAEDHLPNLCN
jgi:uncharacterized protein YjbI with pentapeptide repeats